MFVQPKSQKPLLNKIPQKKKWVWIKGKGGFQLIYTMACRVGKVSEMLYIKYERQCLLKHKRILLLLPLWLEALYCLSSTVAKWVPPQGPCSQPCDLCPPKPLDVRQNIAPRTVTVFGTSSLTFARHQDLPGVEEQSSFLVVTPLDFQFLLSIPNRFEAGVQSHGWYTKSAHVLSPCSHSACMPGREAGSWETLQSSIHHPPSPPVNLPLKVWFCHEPERSHNPLINQCSLSSHYVPGTNIT